jgi:hypothetical protein
MTSLRRCKSDGGKVRTCINPYLTAETSERRSSVTVKEMGLQGPHIFECYEFHGGVARTRILWKLLQNYGKNFFKEMVLSDNGLKSYLVSV